MLGQGPDQLTLFNSFILGQEAEAEYAYHQSGTSSRLLSLTFVVFPHAVFYQLNHDNLQCRESVEIRTVVIFD
jgi:hypothetical protein